MNTQQSICALICQSNGIKAHEIGKKLDLDHQTVIQFPSHEGTMLAG